MTIENGCAPGHYDKKNNTCFSLEQVKELSKAYNLHVSKNKLLGGTQGQIPFITISDDKKAMLSQLTEAFKKVCSGDEKCITRQEFMNNISSELSDDFFNNTFRINANNPHKATQWLSSDEIDKIMKQYEKVIPEFLFMGAIPNDCHRYSQCQLNEHPFTKLFNSGKTKLGIVYNKDIVGQGGSHWVAIYIDLNKGICYYVDSLGRGPREESKEYIDSLFEYYKKKFKKPMNFHVNTKGYQNDGSECGVYSCNFLIRMLAGESFEDYIKNPLSFEEINGCRNVYFYDKISNKDVLNECDPISYDHVDIL